MALIYDNYLEGRDSDEVIDWNWIENNEAFQSSTQYGILTAFNKLDPKVRKHVLKEIGSMSKSLLASNLPSALKKSAMNGLAAIKSYKGEVIPEALVWGQLSWQTYQNILRYFNTYYSESCLIKFVI